MGIFDDKAFLRDRLINKEDWPGEVICIKRRWESGSPPQAEDDFGYITKDSTLESITIYSHNDDLEQKFSEDISVGYRAFHLKPPSVKKDAKKQILATFKSPEEMIDSGWLID